VDKVCISVVIPCFNGEKTLSRQLEALAGQNCDVKFEVVVADNKSTDHTRDIVNEWNDIDDRIQYRSAFGAQGINHARNCGIEVAKGDLILFCDADDRVHPGWIRAYWCAYQSGAQLMGGCMIPTDETGQQIAPAFGLNGNAKILAWPTGANCGIARCVISAIGLLDESYRGGGDETEFFWRAQLKGYQLIFVENAVVDYTQRSNWKSRIKQNIGYGQSQVQLYRQFGAKAMKPPLPGHSMVAAATGLLMMIFPSKRYFGVARFGRNCGRILGAFMFQCWRFL